MGKQGKLYERELNMKKNACYTLCVLLLICIFVQVMGCGGPPDTSWRSSSGIGILGHYGLSETYTTRDFNLQTKKWLTARGFVACENVPPLESITYPENWDQSGVLLLLNHNPRCLIFIFIPNVHCPEDSVQRIDYYYSFAGTPTEHKEYRNILNRLKEDFWRDFPPLYSDVFRYNDF